MLLEALEDDLTQVGTSDLGAFGGLLAAVLGPLGPSWPPWRRLGSRYECLRQTLQNKPCVLQGFMTIVGVLGALCKASWEHLGRLLGPSCGLMVAVLGLLGRLGALLAASWQQDKGVGFLPPHFRAFLEGQNGKKPWVFLKVL